jgi:hypothetical protein
MVSVALLSWRAIAEITMSNNSRQLSWLAKRQTTNSLIVSQFSLIKASRFIQKQLNDGPIRPDGLLERFAKQHLATHSIASCSNVSSALYNSLAEKYGTDDLELFAVCIAIQNDYEYICWNRDEIRLVKRLAPSLVSKMFEIR